MRFCQKCNIFEELAEFEGDKRTCRARLQEHNRCQRRLRSLHLQRLAARRSAAELVAQAAAAVAEDPAGGAAPKASATNPAGPPLAMTDACAAPDPLSEIDADVDVIAQLNEGLEANGSSGDSSSANEGLPDVGLATRVGSTAHDELLDLGGVSLPWLDSGDPGFPGDIIMAVSAPSGAWDEPAGIERIVASDSNKTQINVHKPTTI